MLGKSITLNLSIVKNQGDKLNFVIFITLVSLICTIFLGWELIGLVSSAVVTAIGCCLMLLLIFDMMKQLFFKSLCGEDAYTYMLFPLSSRSVVLGKLVAAMYWIFWNVMVIFPTMMFLYLRYRDREQGVTYWDLDIVETICDDLILAGQYIFSETLSAESIVFLIATALIQILLGAGLLCSGVQLGAILNHVHNRDGRNRYMKAMLALGILGIFTACLYLPTKIFCLVSDGFITILPLVVTMVLEIALIVAAVRWSVKLLQTKYELN